MKRALYIGKSDWEVLKNLFHAHYQRQFKLDQVVQLKDLVEKLCNSGAYDLYLVDVDEKELEPVQLRNDIVELAGQRPMIFIGSPNLLSTRLKLEDHEEMKDDQVLERPLKIDAFKAAIDDCLELLESSEVQHNTIDANEDEFVPIKLRSFYLHQKIEYDAYAKIMPGKFLKVINRDQRYTISYLQSYLRKGVKLLYLKKDERLKLLHHSASQCQLMLSMPDLGLKKALTIQSVGIGIVHEFMRIMGPCQSAFELVNALMESVRKYSRQGDQLLQIFATYDHSNKTIEGRSLLTAYIADSMAIGQGWTAEMLRKKLTLAAIIHDCSLQDDQASLIFSEHDPLVEKFSAKEKENYFNHPNHSAAFAAQFAEVPEVDFIVAQHHENAQGEGFPRKMSSLQVTTLSATFALAVQFATSMMLLGMEDAHLRKIMARLRHESGGGNYRNALKSLEDAIKN